MPVAKTGDADCIRLVRNRFSRLQMHSQQSLFSSVAFLAIFAGSRVLKFPEKIQFVMLNVGSCLGWSGGYQPAVGLRGSAAGKPNTVIVSAELPGGCRGEKKRARLPGEHGRARCALLPAVGQAWGQHPPTPRPQGPTLLRGVAWDERGPWRSPPPRPAARRPRSAPCALPVWRSSSRNTSWIPLSGAS